MTEAPSTAPSEPEHHDIRDLQARLYREIGISAVAAALRFAGHPDPGQAAPASAAREMLPILRDDDMAA